MSPFGNRAHVKCLLLVMLSRDIYGTEESVYWFQPMDEMCELVQNNTYGLL